MDKRLFGIFMETSILDVKNIVIDDLVKSRHSHDFLRIG